MILYKFTLSPIMSSSMESTRSLDCTPLMEKSRSERENISDQLQCSNLSQHIAHTASVTCVYVYLLRYQHLHLLTALCAHSSKTTYDSHRSNTS